QALEYLIKLGHRDIAFLRAKNSYSYDIKEQIYYETLQKHQIPIKEENILVIESGNGLETVELAIQAVQKRLEQKEIPTAIFACNDWMGVGVMQAAKKMGIAIPKDLSVIGYDNIVISEISEPKLTTVDQNMYSLGKASAKLLLDIIKHPTQGFQKIILDTNLIVRDSCTSPKNK
ncbi:MAG: LacI family transcriptional regulator, partial [Epulopiscium sp.]|nr:LacI family transcriptional regulator [Candidatus Epulonipiscium sp.]